MNIGKLVSWLIVGAIAYGGYNYLSTGDITVTAPPQQTVLKLANQANRNLGPKEHLTTGHACVRKGGGMIKQGIFHCEIKVFDGLVSYDTPPKATYTISLTKRNLQWQVIHQSPYKPFTNTL